MPIPARAGYQVFLRVAIGSLCSLLVVLILSPSLAFSQTTTPQLVLDPLNIRQEGVVTLSTLFLGPDSRSDFPSSQFLVGQTDDLTFRFYLEVDSIQQIRFNAFTFSVYLANQKASTKTSYKYQVTGNPTGSFEDTAVRVSFHVKSGSGNSTGTILMPVYNATKSDLLQVTKQDQPVYVSVSGATQLGFQLGNPVDSLPVSVTDVEVAGKCSNCWKQLSSPVSLKSPLQIEPGTSANLSVSVSPNTIPALLQGALILKPSAPHDTVSVTLTYHTFPGGADKKQTILANVRFGPGLFGLALALFGGIALGLTARYLLTGKVGNDNERAFHAVLTALVLGLIAEFVGILLIAYGDSQLVLFGLDVDPRQLFPAFILAILVSGGSAVVSWVKDFLGKAK